MNLRPYQTQALHRLTNRHLTVLPIGLGKTVVLASHAVAEARGGRKALILVHREELIEQIIEKLRSLGYEERVGVIQGPRQDWQTITVAMQQSLCRDVESIPTFDNVIAYEAHRYTTKQSGNAILDAVEAKGARIYGFTATPAINDEPIYGPGRPFIGISFRRTIPWAIANGYLCDVRTRQVRVGIDLSDLERGSDGDYQAGDLGKKLTMVEAPKRIAEAWEAVQPRKRTIVFTPTVEFGGLVAEAFRKRRCLGRPTNVGEVYGDTQKGEGAETIDAFRRGEIDVLVNVIVEGEGFDVPEVDCVVQARPTRSWTLYTQGVGRGFRPTAGKADCLILDVAGITDEHDLASFPKVAKIPDLAKGKSVREVLEEAGDPEAKARTLGLDHGVAELREALLFAPIRWTRVGEEFAAPFTVGQVIAIAPVEGEDGLVNYGVFVIDTRSGRDRKIGVFHYQTSATEVAEDLIREKGDALLSKRMARWRMGPPTESQKRWLAKGVEVPKTRGETSDLLTMLLYKQAHKLYRS